MTEAVKKDFKEPGKRCNRLTRKGEPCPAYAVKGREACSGHLGLGKLDQKAATKRSAEVRKERREARKSRVRLGMRERLALELADRQDEVVRVLVAEALASSDARIILSVLDQALGKPKETVEQVAGDPLDVENLSLDAIQRLKARLIEAHPDLVHLAERRAS